MTDFDALTRANLVRWQQAKLTRKALSDKVAKDLVAAKPRYQKVEAATGVPWPVIAVIHERESSQNWGRSLAQGDPWNKVSIHVPAGRGPFDSWEDAAIDALTECHPYLAKRKDWTLAGVLIALEMYNGIGYAAKGVPSPYLWAGTDQYKSGKYIADGVYNAAVVDQQLGCVAMLFSMMAIDPTITFTGAKVKPAESDVPKTGTNVPNPAQSSGWAAFFSAILSIFIKRK
jgi:lysozyme family protein